MIKNILDSWRHIPYSLKHYVWVNVLAVKYSKTLYPFHDLDKVLLYSILPFLGTERIGKIHRKLAKHHSDIDKMEVDSKYPSSPRTMKEIICDWESAHLSKPDKPLRARETCRKYHPSLEPIFNDYISVVEKYVRHAIKENRLSSLSRGKL